ncbi:MAG: transglycosylase domain-containing protein [Anaerolineales bacterium]|nr:transglycosylase domain-containing protein [Anaerolineales bacterium]
MTTIAEIVRRRQARRQAAQRGGRRWLRWAAGAGAAMALSLTALSLAVAGLAGAVYAYFTQDLPSAEALQAAFSSANPEFFQTTRLYDRTGQAVLLEVIDPRGGDRQYVAYNALPPEIISATVALEDQTFFTNPGYDVAGLARALVSNLQGQAIQGGSSITQQLVKNTLIPLEQRALRSYDRKAREILLAAEITRRYSKEQILEWYLNTNFYGNLAYGVDAAALVYFGKHAAALTLAEAAVLAAIPQSPGLNPADNPELAQERQGVVLAVMAREGFITAAQADAARAAVLTFQPPVKRFDVQAPHFAVWARQQTEQLLDRQGLDGADYVNRGGLKIYTTLDLTLQRQAECVAQTQVARLSGAAAETVVPAYGGRPCDAAAFLPALGRETAGQDYHVTNAAVVALDPRSGEVLALVGSADYWNAAIAGSFNVAVDGLRQPGSAFKPFTYLEAFRQGYAPATMVLDVRTLFPNPQGGGGATTAEPYEPENYDRKFHGPVSMRQALARSYNLPAVDTLNKVGVDNVIRLAQRLGINTLETGGYGLALTLGGGEVTLLDLTYAYSVFANQGVMAGGAVPADQLRPGFRQLDPVVILRVEDQAGRVLYQHAPQTQPVLSPELAYLLTDVLSDNEARAAAFGSDNPLLVKGWRAAAKTGTTNDFRDNWTVGYVPELAVGVWAGNADNTPMLGVSGLAGAAPIWHALLTYATQAFTAQSWTAPAGIVRVTVCEPSGLLPTPYCPSTREEVFLSGNEPTVPDTVWQPVIINRETGRRATACTPPELAEERVFQVLPPEAAEWAAAARLPQPPAEYDAIGTACLPAGNVAILEPAPFSYLRGTVTITGTAKAENFAFFRLQYGPGLYPTAYTQVEGDRYDQMENGWLQTWNTQGLDGLYSLQLVVVKNDPNGGPYTFETSSVPVTIDNRPPTVSLMAPAPGQVYSVSDETVVLQPQVGDNLSLTRVDFYVDGALWERVTTAPYSTRWPITGPGARTVFARAYDAAGNSADSEPVTFTVR